MKTLANVAAPDGRSFSIESVELGSQDPKAPVFGLVGGAHGLERIGAEVVIAFLTSIAERLSWDRTLQHKLEHIRIASIPILNPVGMYLNRRSNGNGVDLMRNAPTESHAQAAFLLGGHRISPILPWYRGAEGTTEAEAAALIEFVRKSSFHSSCALWIDAHSGYGLADRLWFPYARSYAPFPNLPEVHALKALYDRVYPHHVYKIEPQANAYLTSGDPWDYLYDEFFGNHADEKLSADRIFLPLCLEMGSWNWIRKNPLQALSASGPFNPVKSHRKKRTLRRHMHFLEFMLRAVFSNQVWVHLSVSDRERHRREAMELWFNRHYSP